MKTRIGGTWEGGTLFNWYEPMNKLFLIVDVAREVKRNLVTEKYRKYLF